MAWKGWSDFVPPLKAKPAKRHKYGAVATELDGVKFASKKESKRYAELKLLEKAGQIVDLTLQPEFELSVGNANGPVGIYRADFEYLDKRTNKLVVEDVKGLKTPLYKWKKKHVEKQYGIEIREV